MNGPEHYAEAERLLVAAETPPEHPGQAEDWFAERTHLETRALIHATLAQTAVLAEQSQSSMYTMDRDWRAVLGYPALD